MRGIKILEIRVLGWLAAWVILHISLSTNAQKANSIRLLEFNYAYNFPSGDMAERFGSTSGIGFALQSANLQKKLMMGLDGVFLFGNTVKEDVLAGLRTYDGSIIGLDGLPGDVTLKERGFYLGLHAAKVFGIGKDQNTLTGIQAQLGVGLLQHKIRVQDNLESIVALDKKYLNGYDRLSNGPAVHVGFGYQYHSPKNNMHFHIMADLYGASTLSRRDIDYPTGSYLDDKRIDILTGFNVAYIITISRVNKPENIYY